MTLPVFINGSNRIRMAFVCGIVFFLSYTIPNHFHLFPPQQLPLTPFDQSIPLLPWTVFVYVSEYVLFISAYFMFDDELNRNKYIWTYFGVSLVGALFFVFWPTTYPRANYPIPVDTTAVTRWVFNSLRAADDPANCFPSMHVALCFSTAFAFLPKTETRIKFWTYFVWATLVAISTLPTKQHYLADVLGGITLAGASYIVFFKKAQYAPLAEFVRRRQVLPD